MGRDRRPDVVILGYFNYQWGGGEVGRWERCKGSEVGEGCEDVGGSWFYSRLEEG